MSAEDDPLYAMSRRELLMLYRAHGAEKLRRALREFEEEDRARASHRENTRHERRTGERGREGKY